MTLAGRPPPSRRPRSDRASEGSAGRNQL